MMVGLQGTGKTTSAAKIARICINKYNRNPMFIAADVIRPAAIDQLKTLGNELGIETFSLGTGVNAVETVRQGMQYAREQGYDTVFIDTAGRLHNKENLVRELQKINKTCTLKADEGCYKKLIVIDATTGQNALRQAEVFNEAVGLDAIILTKYDSTAKGGVAVSIGRELGIPVAYICTGEKYDDISQFNPDNYIEDFLGL
jgi:fused signal recognition particle receptor